MKVNSKQVIATIERVFDFGVIETIEVKTGKSYAELSDQTVDDGGSVELGIRVKNKATGAVDYYGGTVLGISPRAVFIPTGSTKGLGKPNQRGAVALCRDVIQVGLGMGKSRKDIIEQGVKQGLNKYTMQTQYAKCKREFDKENG